MHALSTLNAANASLLQLTPTGGVDVVVDLPSTVLVVIALLASLAAVFFSIRFAQAIGGELGAAFRYVMIGFIVFAVSRVDDVLKVSGTWAKWGIDYKRTLWVPHSSVVVVAWALITYGCYRMWKTFRG
jgi:hypothetical protein